MTPPRAAGLLGGLLISVAAATLTAQKTRPVPLESIAPLDLAHVLDTYAAGQFDEAVRAVAQAGDQVGRHLRRHWSITGRAWIDASPADRPHRALVAAALALETEQIRVDRGDWGVSGMPSCAGPCVLDWAQSQLVERGAPDAAERAWYLATAALASGVRDWRYLQRTVDPVRQPDLLPGLMDRALTRFPGDVALRLEHALAAASRFSVVVDGEDRPSPSVVAPVIPPGVAPLITLRAGRGVVAPPRPTGEVAVNLLTSLTDDPQAGGEARLRLGYLHWALGHDEAARTELTNAAAQARDADLHYLAEFLLGWTAMERGDSADARPHLMAALEIRPASQPAAVLLGAIELQRGDAGRAHDIARAAMDRPDDVDPWRLFLYGHHPQLAARMADLRRLVHS